MTLLLCIILGVIGAILSVIWVLYLTRNSPTHPNTKLPMTATEMLLKECEENPELKKRLIKLLLN